MPLHGCVPRAGEMATFHQSMNNDGYLGDGYWLSIEDGRAVTRRIAYWIVGKRLVLWLSAVVGYP